MFTLASILYYLFLKISLIAAISQKKFLINKFCFAGLEYSAFYLGLEQADLAGGLVGHLMESNWGRDRY